MEPSRAARAALLSAALVLCLAAPSAAREPGGGWGGVSRAAARGWHSPHAHRGAFVPVALDRRVARSVILVQPVFLPPVPSALRMPTVLDLPVEIGIREAKPAQPIVFVLNDNGEEPAGTPVRLSSGPRIVDLDPQGGAFDDPAEPASPGAKIIHLAVPVGGFR